MKVVFAGHACFNIIGSKNILIDPFITGNPLAIKNWQEFEPDYILITHAHNDHLGDAVKIAKKSSATILAMVDLAEHLKEESLEIIAFNLGGTVDMGELKVKMIPAWHGSTYYGEKAPAYGGVACGYIIWLDGFCIYHAGDTALFGDMKTVIALHKLDLALLPIGDFYTMGPQDALIAASWLKAKTVIPMHYNTFPKIYQDVDLFKKQVESQTQSMCIPLAPGEEITL
ncbi:MAG: metal-dependent hydrolase [Bacillota bacterium]|jgi:L-ascorbate metabolism protein UlaG (beta-lactamase superfamily)